MASPPVRPAYVPARIRRRSARGSPRMASGTVAGCAMSIADLVCGLVRGGAAAVIALVLVARALDQIGVVDDRSHENRQPGVVHGARLGVRSTQQAQDADHADNATQYEASRAAHRALRRLCSSGCRPW